MAIRKTTVGAAAGSPAALQRGSACLCCRKRKLKCDGTRPVCQQCVRMKRANECEYDDKRQKSRTQKLKETLEALEEKLRKMEEQKAAQSPSGSSSSHSASSPPPPPTHFDNGFDTLQFHPSWPSLSQSASSSSSSLSLSMPPIPSTSAIPMSYNDDMTSFLDQPFLDFASFDFGHQEGIHFPPWDTVNPLPETHKKILLDIFDLHRHQCWWEGDMSRFRSFDHSGWAGPHPALWNAVYLLGCYFGRDQGLLQHEPYFLSMVQHEINEALAASSQLVDVVRAQCLLAIYFYMQGRQMEGYTQSFSAARLAIGMGLHQIRPTATHSLPFPHEPVSTTSTFPIVLPPPVNRAEQKDRISTFWQLFIVDRCWSVVNELPLAIPDASPKNGRAQIITPWPKHMDFGEAITADSVDGSTVRAIFEEPAPAVVFPMMAYHPTLLRVKAAAFYERTFCFSSLSNKQNSSLEDRHRVYSSLKSFHDNLLLFQNFDSSEWSERPPYLDHELLAIHTLTEVAELHLVFDSDLEIGIQAANSVMSLIRRLSDTEYKFLDPIMSSCWMTVANFFIRILGANLYGMSTVNPMVYENARQGLPVIIMALRSLGCYVPLAFEYAERLDQEQGQSQVPATWLL